MLLAVNAGAAATPLASVFTVTDVTDPGKVPLAPLAGAMNVTGTFWSGLLPVSVTLACRAVPNAAPIVALCGVPAVATMFTVTDVTNPGKLPLAPLAGAANVTATPDTGFPPPSVALACRAVPNAAPIVALCPEPAMAAMFAGGTARF